MVHIEELRKEAARILKGGKVSCVLGYKRSPNGFGVVPAFIRSAADVRQLTWDASCFHNLARYIADEVPKGRVGIVAKGCDSRAVNVLIQEKVIQREDVYIIGVSCEQGGVVDVKKITQRYKKKKPERIKFEQDHRLLVMTRFGNIKVPAEEIIAEKCLECVHSSPVVHDVLFGDPNQREVPAPYRSLLELEDLSNDERWAYWKEQADKCIRCYACRSVCPLCYCKECMMDPSSFAVTPETTAEEKAEKIKWIEKSPASSENLFYHLLRTLHLAGRCVDCGECGRACPVDIPLRRLHKKMEKDARELFGYESGLDPLQPPLAACFDENDPQDFIM